MLWKFKITLAPFPPTNLQAFYEIELIELKDQVCDNNGAMEQNEAEMKSEEKSGRRPRKIK